MKSFKEAELLALQEVKFLDSVLKVLEFDDA